MAKGKKISEQPITDSLQGSELIPFALNGENGAVTADTLREYATEELAEELEKKADKETVNTLASDLGDKADKADTYTKSEVDGLVGGVESAAESAYAKKADVPTKVSELENDKKYQTESNVDNAIKFGINAHKTEVESRLATMEYGIETLESGKVDKVSGKQLSTEDFTTALKERLLALNNYDDTELDAKIESLKSRLDTLVGSGDVTAVIDTFQEIEAFLQGVTNTQTLTGLLQEMKSEIVALCADTYISKPANGTSYQFLKADGSVDDTAYLPAATYTANDVLDKIKSVDGEGGGLDADLLDGKHNGELTAKYLGVYNNNVIVNPPKYKVEYSSEIQSNKEGLFPVINNANSILSLNRHTGDFCSQLGFSGNGNLYYRCFTNVSVDTTTPWKQLAFTGSNVASADKLITKQLTNEDLNTIKSNGNNYVRYYAKSDNTCANVPKPMELGFHLEIFGSDNANFTVQSLLDATNGNIYVRVLKGATFWTSWKKMLTEDDITSLTNTITELTARIEALEAQLNS